MYRPENLVKFRQSYRLFLEPCRYTRIFTQNALCSWKITAKIHRLSINWSYMPWIVKAYPKKGHKPEDCRLCQMKCRFAQHRVEMMRPQQCQNAKNLRRPLYPGYWSWSYSSSCSGSEWPSSSLFSGVVVRLSSFGSGVIERRYSGCWKSRMRRTSLGKYVGAWTRVSSRSW